MKHIIHTHESNFKATQGALSIGAADLLLILKFRVAILTVRACLPGVSKGRKESRTSLRTAQEEGRVERKTHLHARIF